MRSLARLSVPLAIALLASFALPAHAEEEMGRFPASARYLAALRELHGGARVDLEELFGLALAAAEEIQGAVNAAEEARAGGKEAQPVSIAPEGLVVSTEEAVFALPDPRFFADQARRRGNPIDRAFFHLLLTTRPDGAWPVYLEQQTDVTGCTRFDLRALPSIYSRWLAFQRHHPGAYSDAATKELRGIDDVLLGDCPCGSRESVLAGLRAFVRALPKAPVAAKVRSRIDDLRAGRAQLREQCQSG